MRCLLVCHLFTQVKDKSMPFCLTLLHTFRQNGFVTIPEYYDGYEESMSQIQILPTHRGFDAMWMHMELEMPL